MKVLFENYNFNAAAKTVTFNTTDSITLEQLLIITNVTTNQIIYNFADPNAGGTIASNVLTLDYNTTSMSSSDKLQIFIDNTSSPASDETLQYLSDQTALLGRMVKLLEPSSRQNSVGMQQVDLGGSTITVNVKQDTMTNGVTSQGFTIAAAESTLVLQSRIAYATLRNQLEFS
jgi:hypothetical protein